jgi:hypothetical protein
MAKSWIERTMTINQAYDLGNEGEQTPDWMEMGSIRVLVYGQEGSGKTHFAGTFPNPFFIDTDRGLTTIRKRHPNAYILPIERQRGVFSTVMAVLRDAVNRTGPFEAGEQYADVKTIVLDGYTALAESLMYEIVEVEGNRRLTTSKPQWDDWNALKARLTSITKLTQDINKFHFVATAWEDITKDDLSGETYGGPQVLGGFSKQIGHFFDEIYYMNLRRSQGDYVYEAHSKKFGRYAAKSRIGVPTIIKDPDFNQLEKAYKEVK